MGRRDMRFLQLALSYMTVAACLASCSSKTGGKVYRAPRKPRDRRPWPTRVVAIRGGVAYSMSFPRDCEIVVLMDEEETPRQTGLRGVPFCYDDEYLWAGTEYEMIYPKLIRILLQDGVVQEVTKYRPKKKRRDFGMNFVAVADGGDCLWVSYQGLWRFDKEGEAFSRVEARPAWTKDANSQQISSIGVRQLLVERDTLWIVTGRILKHKRGAPTYEKVFDCDLFRGPFGFEFTGKRVEAP